MTTMIIDKYHSLLLAVGLSALGLGSLACQINIGGPAIPQSTLPVSTEVMGELTSLWETAIAQALDGRVTVEITQTQLTSFLAYRLQEQEEPFIQEPQVYLQNGGIYIYGRVQKGFLTATVRIVVAVIVDGEGKPSFLLTSADFGPLPVPKGLLTAVSTLLDEAFTGALGPVATGIRIESISIYDGRMSITGRIR
jgi:hypothetical protein